MTPTRLAAAVLLLAPPLLWAEDDSASGAIPLDSGPTIQLELEVPEPNPSEQNESEPEASSQPSTGPDSTPAEVDEPEPAPEPSRDTGTGLPVGQYLQLGLFSSNASVERFKSQIAGHTWSNQVRVWRDDEAGGHRFLLGPLTGPELARYRQRLSAEGFASFRYRHQ